MNHESLINIKEKVHESHGNQLLNPDRNRLFPARTHGLTSSNLHVASPDVKSASRTML